MLYDATILALRGQIQDYMARLGPQRLPRSQTDIQSYPGTTLFEAHCKNSHDMCIIHYIVYPHCGCNHIHRPPTLCNNASKGQQPQKRFEERVITFHPDLQNLVLRRDNYLIESHSMSSGIECDSQICSDAIKRLGGPASGCWEHVATSKHPDLPKTSCPLCGLHKDVIMVMEDAANGCKESAARISESKVMSRKRREARDRILRLRQLQEDIDMAKGGKEKPEEDEDQSGSDPDSIKW